MKKILILLLTLLSSNLLHAEEHLAGATQIKYLKECGVDTERLKRNAEGDEEYIKHAKELLTIPITQFKLALAFLQAKNKVGLERLFKMGFDPNTYGPYNPKTPELACCLLLALAMQPGREDKESADMAKLLIGYGASTSASIFPVGRHSALHFAAINDKLAFAKQLLQGRASPNQKNTPGRTPVHTSARYGSSRVLELLLNNGGKADIADVYEVTPLHMAVMRFYDEKADKQSAQKCVELLLANNANPNAKMVIAPDGEGLPGDTPLHIASRSSIVPQAVYDMLVRAGSDTNDSSDAGDKPHNLRTYQNSGPFRRVALVCGHLLGSN